MISAFHGLAAYRGSASPVALKRALDTALSGVEMAGGKEFAGGKAPARAGAVRHR